MASTQGKGLKSSSYLLLVFMVLTVGIGAVGYHYYLKQRDHIRQDEADDLTAVKRLKINEISSWIRERTNDGEAILDTPILVSQIKKWLADPEEAKRGCEIAAWAKSLVDHYDYSSAQILDANATVRLSVGGDTKVDYGGALAMAVKVGKPVFSAFSLDEVTKEPYFCLLIPILDPLAPGGPLMGIISLRVDPYKFLYPLVRMWPNPSQTAESLLVRRDGDEVVYLNELRHRTGSPLTLRMPVNLENLPGAVAVRGYGGVLEGIDYRGVPVLAAVGPIPDTPWYLVAKIDQEEIYRPIGRLGWRIVVIVGVLIGMAAMTLALIWSSQKTLFLRTQYQSELERIELAKRNAHLMEYANDAIVLADMGGRIIEANERAVESYGYAPDELVGMNIRDLRAPESLPALEWQLEKVRNEGGCVFETLHGTKGGVLFPVEISSRLVEIGGSQFYWGFIRDISERKRAEETLRRSHDELERRVLERTEALSKANEALKLEINERIRIEAELKRSNEALQEFAFIASHDLKEPLRKVQVFGAKLKSMDALDETGKDYLDRMQNAAERMKALIEALLDYASVSTRTRPFSLTNLNRVLSEVLSALEVRIQMSGAEVATSDLPSIEADPSQMYQLFQNIVGNALKFTGTEKPLIRIYAQPGKAAGFHQIVIEDNGIGFDGKNADRIFAPFERLRGHREYDGAGLGLAICRKIVERHGATIRAESEPGKGATFIISLPVRQIDLENLSSAGQKL